MPKSIRWSVWLACVSAMVAGIPLLAQGVVGTWQGTLPTTERPRIVLKISKTETGTLRGVFDRIDQGQYSLPLSSISFRMPELSVMGDLLHVGYEGKLSADGKSLSGIWTQNEQKYPLTFILATPDALWTRENSPALQPMSETADPAFEVATIKPSAPGATQHSYGLRTRRFFAKNSTVEDMMKFAYNVRNRQIEGGPAWIDESRFDIEAQPDTPGVPSDDQDRVMLKKLLIDRFHLTIHPVQRIFPVYALTVNKNAPKLTQSDPGFYSHEGIYLTPEPDGGTRVHFTYDTMPLFAEILMNFIRDRQIVDETGLKGRYDFVITLPAGTLQSAPGEGGETMNPADAFFHATESQLGLKLVPKKEPLEVLVIDRLEKPTPN